MDGDSTQLQQSHADLQKVVLTLTEHLRIVEDRVHSTRLALASTLNAVAQLVRDNKNEAALNYIDEAVKRYQTGIINLDE